MNAFNFGNTDATLTNFYYQPSGLVAFIASALRAIRNLNSLLSRSVNL
ncbi:MAG: hypothetical protein RMX96_23095 [Nostoc sp. ChiSLP02]|nr:hypothetical protein [Nostoc sp. ChiSLP02]